MFSWQREAAAQDEETLKARLHQEIRQLNVSWTGSKKTVGWEVDQKRALIGLADPMLSVRRQCGGF
jgi:hypothetical protein